MDQLSLFSIGVAEPTIADLGGLLAGPGQITLGSGGARLSVLVPQRWRADALAREFAIRDVDARVREADPHEFSSLIDEVGAAPDPTAEESTGEHRPIGPMYLVRSERCAALVPLAAAWTRGAVKQAAALPTAPGGFLRCWALASGRCDAAGYLLGLDPRAEQLHTRFASALSAVGLTGVLLGGRAGGPAVRIVGRRRLARLAEMLGDPPPGAPEDAFPSGR
ncbi:hypothetical protein ABLG96_04780 [Nakamurella sp. A5-74]|uniref:Uncharacterized protein n=1 Tax=Nakamurella sp. A5-74 TaxID=3158264 RepID=A0AAU8DR46_9ACTN